MSHYGIFIKVSDEEIDDSIKRDPERFLRRLQTAIDERWPYAQMESIKVTAILLPPPTIGEGSA